MRPWPRPEPGSRAQRPRYAGGLEPARSAAAQPDRVAPSVRLDAVRFAYGDGPEVLGGVSLSVHRGEIVALEGRKRLRQDDAGEDRGRPARAGERARRRAIGRATYLSQDPGPLPRARDARSTRSRSASAATRRARRRRSSSSASPSRPTAIRATSRAVSASDSGSPRSRSPSRTCSCSTSRRAASTPIARPRSPPGCSSRRRRDAACSSRRTIRCCPRIVGYGSDAPVEVPVAV